MFWILDKGKRKVAPFEDYEDYSVTKKLEMSDKLLSFTASLNDIKDKVVLEGYIETKDERYVIREISKENSGKVTVTAQLDIEALEGNVFKQFQSSTQTVSAALALALAGTGWTVGTVSMSNPNKKRTLSIEMCSTYKVLKQAAATYRVDFVFHSKTQKIDIYDYDTVGSEKGVYFTDELNLKSLSVRSDSYEFYTEIEAYGKDGLTFEEINDGKNYVTNYTYSSKKKRFIWKDERYTVAESLLEDATAKLEDMAVPYSSYTATVIDLAKASKENYSYLDYSIGDVIILMDSATQTKEKQRIVEIKEYPDDPEKNTVTLANTILTFAELTQKYDDAAQTVDNITSDNGTISSNAIETVDSSKLTNLNEAVSGTQVVKDLQADNLYVGGELTATIARIGTLEANTATFEQATIQDLQAVHADINDLNVNKLTAATARITTLEGDYANIKTIMAGNLGAGDITTIVLNATNAVIDSEFIKNLVAQNVTVNDLLAGFISTTRFTVGSESGNLRIEDNTISIKDAQNHVRIQIGEDASGDFTILVYDATGTGQLFNSTGITESGIADGLIKDAKVANDANISATKLDIQSLFNVINDTGTGYTIKGTKVYLDDQTQTLSAAFTQMSSNVSDAVSDASTALTKSTSDIDIANEAITLISGIDTLDALSVILTNDAHVVHTYNDGSGGDYSTCNTSPIVFLGNADVTALTVFMITESPGVSGVWTESSKTYQVTDMTTDDGYVDFKAVYGTEDRNLLTRNGVQLTTRNGNNLIIRSGGSVAKKRFSISKSPDGLVGLSYLLKPSIVAITRAAGENTITFSPSTVTFTAYKNLAGVIEAIPVRFKIEETNDFNIYTEKVAYGTARTSYTYAPTQSSSLLAIKCTVKDATEDTVLDSQTVLVLANADALAERVETAEESVIEFKEQVGRFETTIDGMSETLQKMETDTYAAYANNLAYQFEWVTNKTTTTLTAHVYAVDPETKRRTEVTDDYPDEFFTWSRRSDEEFADGRYNDISLGCGKTITVKNTDFGLSGNVDGWFYPYLEGYLTTRNGKIFTTRSGKKLLTFVY